MSDAVIFFDPIFEEHKTGFGHPERPERLPAAMGKLEESGLLDEVEVRSPREASTGEIELVHTPRYVEHVRSVAEAGGGNLDMDTSLSGESYRAALKAAGAIVQSVDGCLDGEFLRSLCLVRPPGHHALPGRGMGFCLFNNIAIGARYAVVEKGLGRVMIVDWDAHHGNGTQEIFNEDEGVLYVSLHQYPHYPGTGWVDETGKGKGKGFTINIPFPPGTGEEKYLEAFDRIILPAGERYNPDLLLVSAGYDSHSGDLLCQMRLTDASYRKMTDRLVGLAEQCCNGRLIVTLEGGYNLEAQARSLVQTVAGLAKVDIPAEGEEVQQTANTDRADDVIERALRNMEQMID